MHQQQAREAAQRVQALEEQVAKMRQEGASMLQSAQDAKNAYQQQRAFIKIQLGEGMAGATPAHTFVPSLVAMMDEQFGLQEVRSQEGSVGSPASAANGGVRQGRLGGRRSEPVEDLRGRGQGRETQERPLPYA